MFLDSWVLDWFIIFNLGTLGMTLGIFIFKEATGRN